MKGFHVRVRRQTLDSLASAAVLACLLIVLTPVWADEPESGDLRLETIEIPAGPFIAGSDQTERETAYALDEAAYGHSRTREWGWYDDESDRQTVELPTFFITRNLITQADYAQFVDATGHRAPDIDRATWDAYGLIHPYERTRPYAWIDGAPPADRLDHPVVLVNHADAQAFAAWMSDVTGQMWRLPARLELEKAARGTDGRIFPWGDVWDPNRLNSHDAGPFGTVPVGSYPAGASPFGVLDPVGQVFEWTGDQQREGRYWVKGGSWDDKGCGICRPASHHGRPEGIQHILIGFRLVLEPS